MGHSLTTRQVATYCGVTPATVSRWTRSGRLKGRPGGDGRIRVAPNDLVGFLRASNRPVPEAFIDITHTRVLIVDDDPANVEFLQDTISTRPDYEIATAFDAREATLRLATFSPDAIVLDVRLPDTTGIEFCRRVKSNPTTKHIRVIGITGYANRRVEQQMREAGADVCVAKPERLHDLVGLIGSITARPA